MTREPPSNLEDHLGYWLRCLSNQVHHSFAEKLSPHNISVAQWVVLRILYDNDNLDLSRAAELIGVDKSTLSRMIDRLVRRGLVQRSEGKNRRSVHLTLSHVALGLVPKLAKLADENDEEFFKYLSLTQRQDLIDLVKGILSANGWERSKDGKDMME